MNENKPDKFYFTVCQLAEVLKTLPSDFPVLVSGYESGYENFYHPSIITVKHEPENPYYNGEFQTAQEGDKNAFDAVVLARVVRDN
ncbi:MAG: hypothetical protein WBM07_17465 [Chitinivibrionales bacterium]